jgi:transcriptional regulator with GAF, ATPase, and Fis domain
MRPHPQDESAQRRGRRAKAGGPPPNSGRVGGARANVGQEAASISLIGRSAALRSVLEEARSHAQDASRPVCLLGETGTGKELIARLIHELSPRVGGPLEVINCAALANSLLLSTLFGHEKGAFTGAVARQPGLFERADGGAVFLDEVGELAPEHQGALLRVLDDGRFRRVGGQQWLTPDFRLLCATNRDLKAEVEAGRFREDLFYRLRAADPIHIPPLRERPEDIAPLAESFFEDCLGILASESEVWRPLLAYDWPGNVRQLKSFVERLARRCRGRVLSVDFVEAELASFREYSPVKAPPGSGKLSGTPPGACSAGPAPQVLPEATAQDPVEGLLELLRRLDPDGRQRLFEEGAQSFLCRATARFCQERARAERDTPRNVFIRHFGRVRVRTKALKDLSAADQEVLRLLGES